MLGVQEEEKNPRRRKNSPRRGTGLMCGYRMHAGKRAAADAVVVVVAVATRLLESL